jgi:hypothetical protein
MGGCNSNDKKIEIMEFKGTKGKWHVSYEYDEMWEQETAQIGVDNENECFITCWSNFIEDEYKANALLISKAPELLDMLKGIYQMGSGSVLAEQNIEAIEQLIKEATDLQITP